MYLLDTNVVSAARLPSRAPAKLSAWIAATAPEMMFLSSLTVMEIELGALRLLRKDPTQAKTLQTWLHEEVIPTFSRRILAFDTGVALRCAALQVPDPRSTIDAMIAATALQYALTVVTRNVRDFAPMGVPVLNPWEA